MRKSSVIGFCEDETKQGTQTSLSSKAPWAILFTVSSIMVVRHRTLWIFCMKGCLRSSCDVGRSTTRLVERRIYAVSLNRGEGEKKKKKEQEPFLVRHFERKFTKSGVKLASLVSRGGGFAGILNMANMGFIP